MNTTTRKYPRTLNDAFPGGTAYANSIEHHKRSDTDGITIVLVCCVVMACAVVGTWIAGML